MNEIQRDRRGGLRTTAALAATAMTAAIVAIPSGPASANHAVVDRAAFGVSSTGLVNVGPLANCVVTTAFGECEREVAGVTQVGLTTGVIQVMTRGTHDPLRADSDATVAAANLTLAGSPIFSAQTIKSTCVADGTGLTGSIVLADVDILGVEPPAPFNAASPPPNTVALDTTAVRIVLNEQVISADRSQINVNAAHITLFNPLTGAVLQDVVLASTQCSLRAVPVPVPVPVPETEVKGAVKKIDKCDRSGDAFFAKRVRGVKYLVKGEAVRKGVWLRAKTRTVRVRAVPASSKYDVVGKDRWVLRFTNKPCDVAPAQLPATGA